MYKLAKYFVSLFGIGLFPIAPGSIASFFSIILLYLVKDYLTILISFLLFFILFILSIKFIDIYSKENKSHDSSEIVIDEFLGVYLIMFFYDYIKFTTDLLMILLIFILFRFFDITKIYPANLIDKKMNNSFGVILDDLIAGVYCIIFILLINAFI